MSGLYYKYWGKAEKDGAGYHLLPYHCLDVAAVGAVWWEQSPVISRSFCTHTSLSSAQVRAWILFFIALHDYGKFDIRFQRRVKPIWQTLYPDAGTYTGNLPSERDCKEYYHGNAGLFWFKQDHGSLLGIESAEPDAGLSFLDFSEDSYSDQWQTWKPWLEAVAGHHGQVIKSENISPVSLPPTYDTRLAQVDLQARKEWVEALGELFLQPVGLSVNDSPPQCSPLMAGFCSVADWLGSRCADGNFLFHQNTQDLQGYFNEKIKADAYRILEFSGIIGKARLYNGVSALLKDDQQPRSLQTIVDDIPLKPGLTLVEAPTGSGKTEAALSYAWRLLAAGFADSIVFALPTQATANAMLDRLECIAPLLFEKHSNVILAHGSARFNEKFSAYKKAAIEGYEEDGWIQCSQWLAESRKRVFLGQIGVCTVDQVLISVLPVKHRFVRGFGVGRSVLIVDEVHAYDSYMYGLLEEVLKQQKSAGGSAVLLSATLPEILRARLLGAWGSETILCDKQAVYPLITWTEGEKSKPFRLAEDQMPLTLSVRLEPSISKDMLPDDVLLNRIITAAESGAQIAIVCNLVDDAQIIAKRLREKTSLPVDLFHARFCYKHRQEKELDAIARFGPNGSRDVGRIMVATQVIEQSLDLDFDWLITQLCPIDLLFQRMGRLHRHDRPNRPFGFEKPICTVLMPEGHDYGLHGVIYANTRALWRTARKILNAPENMVNFPNAYRDWIEEVYREDPWGDEPVDIDAAYEKFRDEVEFVKRCNAQSMINSAINPFPDTDHTITAVTRDGEMNLTVLPFCAVSEGTMMMDGSILETVDEYKRLEVLALNSLGVPKSWRGYLGEADKEGRYWLEMRKDGDFFSTTSKGKNFRYNKDTGMEKEK
ncbi:MAG: CRISPR-associated helicase/endonuclease Cas3 [Nitrospirae bacterium]|nr:CRISPR-associated helicase/endonuclease Cas3 [Nitrospirota bacterium]MBI5675621.1 CRISPR-associated helicase/endonuclease Cas3 [Nitrospirota bacterium]